MDATMYIVSPGRTPYEIAVSLKEWDEFTEFMKKFGERISIPRGVKTLFLVEDGEKFENLKAEWKARTER